MIRKPQVGEYNEFYATYISKIEGDNMMKLLREQLTGFSSFLSAISEETSEYAYAPGKWSIKGVLAHINDVERIFAYRALCIARGEKTPLPGMDENEYQAASPYKIRTFSSLTDEFVAIRTATLYLFEDMPESDTLKVGTASGHPVSVRALAAMIYGHCEHHRGIIQNRYL
ncbi:MULTISPECIES: DinB family protein [Roseivirga]|jgi:uncharacterized damage-inducible protein DinB|uniref:DNA damage-inducible protein DinB n=1 Tax=Roseivirga thermotolerans TaxID=1758176 RepID=A0ABQ3I9X4_9BACT|nr:MULTISPECIES: DinB family protein [Roseivirga]GHE63238.1 DNA damage-inducible protein DinB [Roseivirga thermotolerans]|tara:strand:+ start:1909 stop:2421 length:513 start_codon:yes stop_codon:yes gene_type:complete